MSANRAKADAAAIVVAAGNSLRMGSEINKQFLPINGIPVLARSLRSFNASKSIGKIVVVTKSECIAEVESILHIFAIKNVTDIVVGGNTRQESVLCGLSKISDFDIVAIHDGARPFVSPQKIDELVDTAKIYGAAAPGIVPKDTVKVISSDGFVQSTPNRAELRLIQTPQVFRAPLIKQAYIHAESSGFQGTDDCSVAEAAGFTVKIIEGENTNIKVTTPEDLPVAEAICSFIDKI